MMEIRNSGGNDNPIEESHPGAHHGRGVTISQKRVRSWAGNSGLALPAQSFDDLNQFDAFLLAEAV
jgi:hypothetical protein